VKSAEVFPDPSEPMAITLFDGPGHMPVDSIGHGILAVMGALGSFRSEWLSLPDRLIAGLWSPGRAGAPPGATRTALAGGGCARRVG
jgi:hypothetical protein